MSAPIVLSQTKFSLLSLSRNKQAVIFTIFFPIVLYVLFSSIFGGDDTTDVPGAGRLDGSRAEALASRAVVREI